PCLRSGDLNGPLMFVCRVRPNLVGMIRSIRSGIQEKAENLLRTFAVRNTCRRHGTWKIEARKPRFARMLAELSFRQRARAVHTTKRPGLRMFCGSSFCLILL